MTSLKMSSASHAQQKHLVPKSDPTQGISRPRWGPSQAQRLPEIIITLFFNRLLTPVYKIDSYKQTFSKSFPTAGRLPKA